MAPAVLTGRETIINLRIAEDVSGLQPSHEFTLLQFLPVIPHSQKTASNHANLPLGKQNRVSRLLRHFHKWDKLLQSGQVEAAKERPFL